MLLRRNVSPYQLLCPVGKIKVLFLALVFLLSPVDPGGVIFA